MTGINDLVATSGRLALELTDASGRTVDQTTKEVPLAAGVTELLRQPLDASAMAGTYQARVRLLAHDGSLIAENEVGFDVFDDAALAVPTEKIAVIDPANALRPFLDAKGISHVEFGEGTPTTLPVIVASARADNPKQKAGFQSLEAFVRRGGTAVYLETLIRASSPYWDATLPSQEVLPIKLGKQHALGLWIGVSHIVRDHPVFAGLPVNCMMGQVYEKVWSPYVLKDAGGELIVGSVSYGFHADDTENQNYLGPEPAWYGMDMGIVPHGKGRYILSTLRLIENLGSDPVADRILYNLVRFAAKAE